MITPPIIKYLIFLTLVFSANAFALSTHAIIGFGVAKYPADFSHFDYVNPNAPKGGGVTIAEIGSYDNFNRFASRGVAAARSGALYDSLFVAAEDEIDSHYPLIASSAQYRDDFSQMTIKLNPAARFHDGEPIDAEDVVFSWQKFRDQGVDFFSVNYDKVDKLVAIDPLTVEIQMIKPDRTQLFNLVTSLNILPKHYWQDRDLSEPLLTPPLSSGPYKISDYAMGDYVLYSRVKDYWAAELPSRKGSFNFDTIRHDYYKDSNVALEAFKAGEFDFRQENVAKNWASAYNGPNIEAGYIVKETIAHQIPQAMQAFVFNSERGVFSSVKVREALTLAMDFQWMNHNLFHDQYSRSESFFQNTPYQAKGLPSEAELAFLEPLRADIPPRVFTEAFSLPQTDGSGRNRKEIRRAAQLLKEAGWTLQDNQLINARGKPFAFELLSYSPTTERIAAPLRKNLKRLGITMNIRRVDTAQYIKRLRERDYDMISSRWAANNFPSSELQIRWHSKHIDSTYNSAGVQDIAIDALVDQIVANQHRPEVLKALGPALDRVLLWGFYGIPQWHLSTFRIATWDKFDRPKIRPHYDLGFNTWWVDKEKALKLPARRQ